MTCVVCLDAAASAERVCSCSALACRVCLLALLDHGRERCAVCGSRFQPSAILNACLLGVEASPADPAKAHLKLAMAYAGAGDPLRALNSLAIAQHSVEPGSRWHSMIALETAQSHLAIGQVASAESCLRSVMPKLLELPRTVSSGVLFANCCTLLCKTTMQQERNVQARAWLRRAINIQADLGLDRPLATSLQLDARLLSREGKYLLAKKTLQSADRLLSRCETDECVRASVKVEMAIAEVQLGETDAAQAILRGVLPTLRRRSKLDDKFSADLLPTAARALALIVAPQRRLRRKTRPECVGHREAALHARA